MVIKNVHNWKKVTHPPPYVIQLLKGPKEGYYLVLARESHLPAIKIVEH